MEHRSFLNENKDLITALILYSFLAVFSLKYYMVIGGDEISYINIAHAYATGNWEDAINGYWSPLYSWLMAPFLLFGPTTLYTVYISRVLSLAIGFFTIISIRKLTHIFNLNKTVKSALTFSLVPSILFFSLMYPTPDLLAALILICYLSIILDTNYSNNLFNGALCGFIGAAAYFTKSYLFMFFLVHFILFNSIYYFKCLNDAKKKNILKNLVLGLSIFFVISGLWAGVISEKYGKLTISTSGEYNQAVKGPEYPTDPVFYAGLFKPPNNSSTSIWDDPSYIKVDPWSPFNSIESFKYELQLIWKNILRTTAIIESFFIIAFIIIISSILFIFRSKSEKISKDQITYLLITIVIYIGGYCFIAVEWRYFFFIFILLMLTGFYLIDNLYKSKTFNATFRNVLLLLLILSFIIQPMSEMILFAGNDNSYNLSNTLKDEYGVHGNIASDEWGGKTLTISYYLNAKYYGKTNETDNSTELQNELENNNIDYYFVWNKSTPKLSDYKEITNGKLEGLKIYSRIKKLNHN